MAYANADTGAKVGFRPYHETDPFGAAHLSGVPTPAPSLGAYFYNRPFDPWELHADTYAQLHGLGQNHPFKPTAWALHGLAGLGDVSDAVGQAVEEYVQAGKLDGDQASAIMSGANTFSDFGLPDPTDQSTWTGMVGLLQQGNQDLQKVETAYAAAGASGQFAGNSTFIALGKQIATYRQQYSDIASQFVHYYTMMTGTTPAGLSGLGIVPIIAWAAGAAIFLITAGTILYAIHTWAASVNVNAIKASTAQTQAVSTAGTNQNLLQALAAAQASGDTATASQILKTLQATGAQPVASPDLQWLETNAKWIGLGLAGLIVIGPLSQGLFGGRRR